MSTASNDVMRTHQLHPITRSFHADYERCLAPRRHRLIVERWSSEPALADRSIDDIVAVFSRRGTEQNATLESLIRLHQQNDSDATTLLMVIIHPVVVAAAARLTSDRHHRHDAAWAAAGHALATMNPVEARSRADHHGHPMLAHLAHRLRNSDWALNPSDRNNERRRKRSANDAITVVSLDDERCYELPDRSQPDPADRTQAIIDLERLSAALASGEISREEWRFLVDHRFYRTSRASGRKRAQAYRITHRLATLVGRAA